MNNQIAAPAGHFPLFDDGQRKEDGTYSSESHTVMSDGWKPPSPHPSHPRPPQTPGRRRINIT